mmetsp:Transcript_41326/g.110553  ORF Transcript_41326/g.110553 Transcript_41326/m.110553 type:complete len:407 (-) Transcript_41326:107-1327(-)
MCSTWSDNIHVCRRARGGCAWTYQELEISSRNRRDVSYTPVSDHHLRPSPIPLLKISRRDLHYAGQLQARQRDCFRPLRGCGHVCHRLPCPRAHHLRLPDHPAPRGCARHGLRGAQRRGRLAPAHHLPRGQGGVLGLHGRHQDGVRTRGLLPRPVLRAPPGPPHARRAPLPPPRPGRPRGHVLRPGQPPHLLVVLPLPRLPRHARRLPLRHRLPAVRGQRPAAPHPRQARDGELADAAPLLLPRHGPFHRRDPPRRVGRPRPALRLHRGRLRQDAGIGHPRAPPGHGPAEVARGRRPHEHPRPRRDRHPQRGPAAGPAQQGPLHHHGAHGRHHDGHGGPPAARGVPPQPPAEGARRGRPPHAPRRPRRRSRRRRHPRGAAANPAALLRRRRRPVSPHGRAGGRLVA